MDKPTEHEDFLPWSVLVCCLSWNYHFVLLTHALWSHENLLTSHQHNHLSRSHRFRVLKTKAADFSLAYTSKLTANENMCI